jgi:hypothetical protein
MILISLRRAESNEQAGQLRLMVAFEADCVVRVAERRQQPKPGGPKLARPREVDESIGGKAPQEAVE